MILLKTLKDLTLMKNILHRELPHSITVLGGVLHILHNNPCHLEMCVDSWPTFTTAICYRQKQRFSCSSSEPIPDVCTFFTKSPASLRNLLLNERVVNWSDGIVFRGIPSSLCHLIQELASVRGLDVTQYGGYNTFIHHMPESVSWRENASPPPISVLDESHAELVDACLPYGGSRESLNHVRACIRHLPNRCLTDEGGRPVSWMLTDELCELRMAYTLPEHRRSGHLRALSVAMIATMSSLGLPVYCHVHRKNRATVDAVTSLGLAACPGMEDVSVLLICKNRV